nr:DUF2252 domain-containing protein [Kiloniellales bacterium]
PADDRPDPVELLEEQNKDRLEFLVPVRRWRMSASPFAFFRGSATIMAADLATTPVTGLTVQACGDAHVANFGLYASPERRLVFDINDFDETLPGPWEWDIKRLATSFMIAARHNGLDKHDRRDVTERVVRNYRKAMAEFAEMRTMDVWYALVDTDRYRKVADKEGREGAAEKIMKKAVTRDSRQALDKLTEEVNGDYRIKSEPPGLIPMRELRDELELKGRNLTALVRSAFAAYKESVPDDCKHALSRFRPVDVALKVVGVGSVGTQCLVMLLEGRDRNDPMLLQIKQATRSVLEKHLPRTRYKNHGQRVVEGQRLLQTVNDIFLGWTVGQADENHYYWRQLRDWKGSADVEDLTARDLRYLARLCGWTLAQGHARTGDPVSIAGYLGSKDTFDDSLVEFAKSYADQNERDYSAFMEEIHNGRLATEEG